MRFLLILFSFVFIQLPLHAQWYETEGKAYITNNDTQAARSKAIENALKKTLLIAGASVSSVQQVVNGLLTKDEVNIRATGIINAFELVSENYADNMATVVIRADIFAQEKKCFSADYRKSLLITQSKIINREQANLGEIYDINSAVMQKLADKINQNGHYLTSKLNLKNSTEFSRYNHSLQIDKINALSKTLGEIYDVQFVMFSEITDISFNNQNNNTWQFWQDDIKDRFFHISLYIYDSLSGEQVLQKSYQTKAPWTFSERQAVDVNSDVFWQAVYGGRIVQLLNDMVLDIDDNLMCLPTQGKIIYMEEQKLTINLGKRHGVKLGDKFSLLHSANITTNTGKKYTGYNVSPFKVKVIAVNETTAIVSPEDNQPLGNIQIEDIAVRY